MTDPESPAFPRATPLDNEVESRGLTKREYFAAIALNGMIAGSQGLQITTIQFAKQSLVLADKLIEELNG